MARNLRPWSRTPMRRLQLGDLSVDGANELVLAAAGPGLSRSTINLLWRHRVRLAQQLIDLAPADLFKLSGIGLLTLEEIDQWRSVLLIACRVDDGMSQLERAVRGMTLPASDHEPPFDRWRRFCRSLAREAPPQLGPDVRQWLMEIADG